MKCPSCGHVNRARAKFCEECSALLSRKCARCGTELRAAAKFCDECAAPVDAPPASRPVPAGDDVVARKVLTIVFADLIGSTSLHERLDPESVSRVMERYHRAVAAPIEAHGGTVVQLLGDGVMCAFTRCTISGSISSETMACGRGSRSSTPTAWPRRSPASTN
ncbi:MAG: double zinc ribbon domain-containing protein [Candidatus Binatia bacterium]